ncbi:hypothetical protein JCM11641_006613 [Rhodosporidiobolus odoratus]
MPFGDFRVETAPPVEPHQEAQDAPPEEDALPEGLGNKSAKAPQVDPGVTEGVEVTGDDRPSAAESDQVVATEMEKAEPINDNQGRQEVQNMRAGPLPNADNGGATHPRIEPETTGPRVELEDPQENQDKEPTDQNRENTTPESETHSVELSDEEREAQGRECQQIPLIFPESSWIDRNATRNRFHTLSHEGEERAEEGEQHDAVPPKPVPQQKRRKRAAIFHPDKEPEDLAGTIAAAANGNNFKHRVWAKGPEVEVAQAVAIQMGTYESEVAARVIPSNGAFQILLGKPWKAEARMVHFYEVDCIMHPTTVPGKWATLWNENPKSCLTFTSIPSDPAALTRLLEAEGTRPSISLTPMESRSTLEQAMLTPLPDDDDLLTSGSNERILYLSQTGAKNAPTNPAAMAHLLKTEEWRRQLRLHPVSDSFYGEPGRSAFLADDEVETLLQKLEAEANDKMSEFWQGGESLADFWAITDGKHNEEWETWRRKTLPRMNPDWRQPPPQHRRRAQLHVYLAEQAEERQQPQEEAPPEDGEPTLRERIAELRRVLKVGDDRVNLSESEKGAVFNLCEEFIDQFAFSLKDVRQTDTVELRIPTPGATPTRARYRPVNNEDQRRFLHDMVNQLLAADIISHVEPDEVTWVSHNKVAPKASHSTQALSTDELLSLLEQTIQGISPEKDGWVSQRLDELPVEAKMNKKFRLCHAFLDLNDATVGGPFPVGDLEGKIARLCGKKIFSCFDLHSGYFAIKIRKEDQLKATFGVEDKGFFAYKRMPFGLKGAPAAFCELIATAFEPVLGKAVEAWMDDLATSANSFDDHLANVRTILEICKQHNLSLNPAKCQLFTSGMVWCGNYLSEKGRQPDSAKVQAVVEWPEPANALEVLQFLNFAGYYRPLIKGYAAMTEPLARVTKGVKLPPKRRYGKNGGSYKPQTGASLSKSKQTQVQKAWVRSYPKNFPTNTLKQGTGFRAGIR